MELIRCFIYTLKKYAVFNGRASRKEYWSYILVFYILFIIATVIDFIIGIYVFGPFLAFVFLLPTIAVSVRRMHDVNKFGWFVLIPVYNLILTLIPGDIRENKFGNVTTI